MWPCTASASLEGSGTDDDAPATNFGPSLEKNFVILLKLNKITLIQDYLGVREHTGRRTCANCSMQEQTKLPMSSRMTAPQGVGTSDFAKAAAAGPLLKWPNTR